MGDIMRIAFALLLTASLSLGQTMNVHTASGVEEYSLADIDSITFELSRDTIPTENLVAYYPFNGNANDESGNGNNGTVQGATLTADRFGNANKAYRFDGGSTSDGDGDAIDLGPSLNGLTSQPLSVSLWVKTDSTGKIFYCPPVGELSIGATKGSHDSAHAYQLFVDFIRGGTNGSVTTSPNTQTNNWQHLVCVYEQANKMAIYLDGKLAAEKALTVDATADPGNSFHISIGAYVWTGGKRFEFTGDLDDIRIYNKVLTASEVRGLYSEGS